MNHFRASSCVVVVVVVMFSAAVASAGLVGFYPLRCNLADVSVHHNDGTLGPDGPTYPTGLTLIQFAGATFSGTDPMQYFTLPINLNAYDQVTFGAEITVTKSDPIRGIISNDPGGFGRTIDVDFRAGTTGISAFDGNGVFGGVATTGDSQFVAVTYDHTAGTESFYVDSQKFTATGVPPDGDNVITVGRNPHFDMPFGGVIRNLFVFDSVLSDAQIGQLRSQGGFAILPGDANGDGTVNFADLLILAQHYGSTTATWSQGDFTCDGIVGFADLLVLAQTYGKSSIIAGMPAATTDAVSSVPEPVGLCSLALMALAVRRVR